MTIASSTSLAAASSIVGQFGFGADAGLEQQRAGARHRPFFLGLGQGLGRDLLAVADAGMRAEALGDGLDEDRALAGPHLLDDLLHAFVEGDRVVAVEPHALEAVAGGAAGEIRAGGVVGNERVFADLVVLAQEDDRQLPGAGQVHRLMHRADAGGAVTEIHDRHAVLAARLRGEGEAIGDRRAGADDGGGEHGAGGGVGDMRRAALALVHAVDAPHGLGEQLEQVTPLATWSWMPR